MTAAAEQWHADQQRAAEQALLQRRWFAQRDEVERRSWPVLVTYTHKHVLWVEAETHDKAVEAASYEPYEKTDDQETLFDIGYQVERPSEWDWDDVYEGNYCMPYQGLECNAHVETYRSWSRALDKAHQQATADNEDLDGVDAEQRLTCSLCRTWREAGHDDSFPHKFEMRAAERRAQEAVTV